MIYYKNTQHKKNKLKFKFSKNTQKQTTAKLFQKKNLELISSVKHEKNCKRKH